MNAPAMNPSLHAKLKRSGFTLVELLIAVIIIAVLTSVAMPSFLDAIRKGRRSEAFTAINAVQQAQERFRANNQSFATSMVAAVNATPPGLGLASTTTPSGYYTLALSNVAPSSYTITATAVSGTSQANDSECVRLQVAVNGGNMVNGSYNGGGTLNEAVGNRCWSR